MQIIEHFIQGKRNNAQLCEDGWVVTPHFAAVVDGSTSKVAGRNGGRMELYKDVEVRCQTKTNYKRIKTSYKSSVSR